MLNDTAQWQLSITPDIWACLVHQLRMSDREQQVALAVLEDQKELVISQRLGISEHTVHTHLERLYHKLNVSSRLQLVSCIARCWIDLIGEPGGGPAPLCPERHTCDQSDKDSCPLSN